MQYHYIASAGTGKTYSLVEEVIKKILQESISLENILILTFTEKSAQELRERILNRLKLKLKETKSKKEKIKIHREIFLRSDYIGTFHSIFFRFLKKYPEYTHIDNSYEILSEDLRFFLESCFERWIDKDFYQNKDVWEEITDLFSLRDIKKNLFFLYENRLKISIKDYDLVQQKQLINKLAEDLKSKLSNFLKVHEKDLNYLKDQFGEDIFRNSPYLILSRLNQKDYTDIPINPSKKFLNIKSFFFKNKGKEFSKSVQERFDINKLESTGQEIQTLLQKLKVLALDYNTKLLLDRFFSFLDFVEAEKREHKKLDFNDILEKTLKLLEDSSILKSIRSRFKYIFIDEFQDTDKIQIQIINKIADNNLYIFADPKQCIYTWRDADLEAYLDFVENQNFTYVTLDKNYRSSPVLIEFFNLLFSGDVFLNHLDKKYRSPVYCADPHKFKNKNSFVKILNIKYDKKLTPQEVIEKEAIFCVYLVKDLLNEGHKPDDIMFLFRKNKDLNLFLKIFNRYNVPVVTQSNESLFNQPEIKQIIDILRFIEYPQSRLLFLKVLKSPLFLFSDKELYSYKEKFSLEYFDTKEAQILKELIEYKYDLSLYEIVYNLIENTNILEYNSLFPNGKQRLLNIEHLKTIAQKLSSQGFSLRDFIIYTQSFDIEIPVLPDQKAVKFLTMHKAKGLESKVVIIPLISIRPESVKLDGVYVYKNKPVLNLKKAKSIELINIEKDLKEKIKNESERLFYVAVTRAKEKLILITTDDLSRNYKDTYWQSLKRVSIDQYVESVDFSREDITESTDDNLDFESRDLLKELKAIERVEKEILEKKQKAIETKRFLSVSELVEEEKQIEEGFSSLRSSQVSIYTGIVVHEVLEKIDLKNYSYKTAKRLLEQIQQKIPSQIKTQVLDLADIILKKLENSTILEELKYSNILAKEMPFVLEENGKIIEGRIDLIYEKAGKIVILDYKTNKYETEKQLENIKATYRKQKEYYKKALEKIFPDRDIEFKLALLWQDQLISI